MIKKCLFPAAGYGTRFLPATKAIPKEMLPVNAKPLIQYGIEEALNAKCDTMAIVTGRGKRAIEDHFDASYELEAQLKDAKKEHFLEEINDIIARCTFTYTRQKAMKGLGDAILTGESLIGGEAFGVILADDLCINENGDGVLAQMAELYAKYRCAIVAIQEVPKDELNKYGVIDGVEIERGIFEIKSMVEKPEPKDAPSNLAVIGRYILTPDIFSILRYTKADKKGEIQITDALNKQAQISRVLAYKFKGIRYDCGSVEGFVRANNELFAKTANLAKIKSNPCDSTESRPLRGAKNRIQGRSSASADFLLEADKRGSPPKSEKRELLARRGSGAGGAALLRKKSSKSNKQNDKFGADSTNRNNPKSKAKR